MNFMTESDDKTRWILAYALFGVAVILAVIQAYQSHSHNHLGRLSFGLPFMTLIPILNARTTLSAYEKRRAHQLSPELKLDISFRLWVQVIFAYTLLVMSISVGNLR